MMRIDPNLTPLAGAKQTSGNSKSLISEISDSFSQMMDEVNKAQLAADQKIQEFATSKEKDIHGTMIAMQKADISLRLLLQVRSKLTNAYQEISRMQV